MSSVDLVEELDTQKCEVLNADSAHPLRHVLSPECRDDGGLVLKSDVDEELLVILRFQSLVKVCAIALRGPVDCGPSSVKVFCNPLGLGIDTAGSSAATQTLQVSQDALKSGDTIALRFVLYQKVSALALFFPANHSGAAVTVVERLAIYGQLVPQEGSAWAKAEAANTKAAG